MFKRYILLVISFVFLLAGCQQPVKIAQYSDWAIYKKAFITSNGRVIDTANHNISHSEGQGTGMLLAETYNDLPCFNRIWSWTRHHLQIRRDYLFAWRWNPRIHGVTDLNDATDGDILIAWALLRASRQWEIPYYRYEALRIIRDIRRKLVLKTPWGLVLLPGARGFIKRTGVEVNPSYWIYPALKDFADVDNRYKWNKVIYTGLSLLKSARYGRWHLPPDWLFLNDGIRPYHKYREKFGFNAIRIPLYLVWAQIDDPGLLKPFVDYYSYFKSGRFIPAWTNLYNNSVDSYNAPEGIHAILQLTLYAYNKKVRHESNIRLNLPKLKLPQNYYSASLLLMSKIALKEGIENE